MTYPDPDLLEEPRCPICQSKDVQIDVFRFSNLLWFPLAVIGVVFAGLPMAKMAMKCRPFGHKYVGLGWPYWKLGRSEKGDGETKGSETK